MGSKGLSCPAHSAWETYARAGTSHNDIYMDAHLSCCGACRSLYFSLIHKPYTPQVPQCHIVGEIGRGRFGVVYKAWWIREKPEVIALKLLHSFGEMERNRFEREISVLSHLQSPGIVRCRDSGGMGDARYFIMDFVSGMHLDDYVRRTDLELSGKLEMLRKVCLAVADAHAAGVIHRDLKPRNILIDDNGQPHILDFGICSVSGVDWTSWADGTITLPGDIIGTLKYMSPEQAWGGGIADNVNHATDLWALGIMLYEIATNGDYPYNLKSSHDKPAPEALLDRIRKEIPRMPNLSHLPRGHDLEILIERCLTWEPQRRLSSAAALAKDLQRYIVGDPVHTRGHGRGYRIRRVAVGAATRSRAPFHTVFMALALAGVSLAALVSGAGWRVTGSGYAAPANASRTEQPSLASDHIRVIGIGDESLSQVPSWARKIGMEPVTDNVTSWRAVHGRLMERLAKAAPAAVIWDYYFRTAQPGDEQFAAGVRTLEAAGVPTVLAARTFDASGRPDISPTLLSSLNGTGRFGAILARDMVQRTGEFVVAVKRPDNTVLPSVTLVALSGILRPASNLEATWYGDQKSIDMLYETTPGSYLRQRDRMDLTRVVPAGAPDPAVSTGDKLGCVDFSLAPAHEWQKRTLAYESLLSMTDEQLRTVARGKVLIFGDVRKPSPGFAADRHPVKYPTGIESNVPGCYLLADAMTGMMNHHFLRLAYPLSLPTTVAILAFAFVGCALAIPFAGTTWFDAPARRFLAYAVPCLFTFVGAGLLWRSESSTLVHGGMGLIALAAPLAGSLWVEFTRNRHRMLDRRSQSLRPFSSASAGQSQVDAINAAA